MEKKYSENLWQTIGFGLVSGVQSIPASVLLSHFLTRRFAGGVSSPPFRFWKFPLVNKAFPVRSALAKTDSFLTPEKITPRVMAGRAVSGALAGAIIHKANGGKLMKGAIIGGLAAIAAVYALDYIRKKI